MLVSVKNLFTQYLHDVLLGCEVGPREKAREVSVLNEMVVCLEGRVKVDGTEQLFVKTLLQVQQDVTENVLLQSAQQEQNPGSQNTQAVAYVLVCRQNFHHF